MSGTPQAELTSVTARGIKIATIAVLLLLVLSSEASARRRLPAPPPAPSAATPPADATTSNAPFRAKLVENAALARKTAATLNSISKMPAQMANANAKLSSAERKLFADQTKWLTDSSGRLTVLASQMDVVLAKTNAPATELAQTNMKLLTLREALESESRRFGDLAPARARHQAALHAINASK